MEFLSPFLLLALEFKNVEWSDTEQHNHKFSLNTSKKIIENIQTSMTIDYDTSLNITGL
jgi:hypothetical protein